MNETPGTSPRPLAGFRVLDFSRLLPGPYCTCLLARLGAEVIRVEDVAGGDLTRSLPPLHDGVGAIFHALHRGKQSVALDLKQLSGQRIAQGLAAQSDVVVEGFRPGVAARLGIDFATLATDHPRLIHCSISGYGQAGELRDLPGHDLTYAAMTGLLDALSPGEPRVPGVQLVDAAAALLAAVQILAALHAREQGPCHLDVSLAAAARALMPGALIEAAFPPASDRTLMDLLRGGERNNVYLCADGRWLALSPVEDWFWERLTAALASGGALDPDQALDTNTLRSIFRRRPAAEWFSMLAASGIPCAPVRTVNEAQEPLPSGALAGILGPDDGGCQAAPILGQHTAVWLARLGYTPDQVQQLQRDGVVRLGTSPSFNTQE